MIKNQKLWALSLSSLLILTACGGGGGGDGTSDSGVSVNQPVKMEVDGGIVNVKGGKATDKKYTKSDNMDILIVDGKKLQLDYGFAADANSVALHDHMVYHNSTAYARYGLSAINSNYNGTVDDTTDLVFYYQGQATPVSAIPKTGSITYTSGEQRTEAKNGSNPLAFMNGGAIMLDKDKNKIDADVVLTANFDKKELTGTVGHYWMSSSQFAKQKYGNIPIYAKIDGNKFAGTKNNVTTEGKFFGPNADTVAGTFQDKGKQLTGSFAATKDK